MDVVPLPKIDPNALLTVVEMVIPNSLLRPVLNGVIVAFPAST